MELYHPADIPRLIKLFADNSIATHPELRVKGERRHEGTATIWDLYRCPLRAHSGNDKDLDGEGSQGKPTIKYDPKYSSPSFYCFESECNQFVSTNYNGKWWVALLDVLGVQPFKQSGKSVLEKLTQAAARQKTIPPVTHEEEMNQPEEDFYNEDDIEETPADTQEEDAYGLTAEDILEETMNTKNVNLLFEMKNVVLFAQLPLFEFNRLLVQLQTFFKRTFPTAAFKAQIKEAQKILNHVQVDRGEATTNDSEKEYVAMILTDQEPRTVARNVVRVLKDLRFYTRRDGVCKILPHVKPQQGPLQAFDNKQLRSFLIKSIAFKAYDRKGVLHFSRPDEDILNYVQHNLDIEDRPDIALEELEGVTTIPILTPEGQIITKHGYNPDTQMYYQPKETRLSLPGFQQSLEQPVSQEDATRDLLSIARLFDEFPWEDQASKANFLATLLTGVVRPSITGCIPLILFDGNTAGAGKGLLASSLWCISQGRTLETTGFPTSNEEMQKTIISILAAGHPLVTCDNIVGKIFQPALTLTLTSRQCSGRLLGGNDMISLPQRTIWTATGNNMQVGDENVRRCLLIRLTSPHSHPQKVSNHRIPNLEEYLLRARPVILQKLLRVAKAWFDLPEEERPSGPYLGSFESWSHKIGGMLAYAQFPGFMENQEQLENRDSDTPEWIRFLAVWFAHFQDRPVEARDVIRAAYGEDATNPLLASSHPAGMVYGFKDALPGYVLDEVGKKTNGASRALRLGNILRTKVETPFGGLSLKFLPSTSGTKPNKWKVSLVVPQE